MTAREFKRAISGGTEVAGTSRSPLLRLPTQSLFSPTCENPALLTPAASDCAACEPMKEDPTSRDEAECLAVFNPVADLSTHQTGKSVRRTRATTRDHLTTEDSSFKARYY